MCVDFRLFTDSENSENLYNFVCQASQYSLSSQSLVKPHSHRVKAKAKAMSLPRRFYLFFIWSNEKDEKNFSLSPSSLVRVSEA